MKQIMINHYRMFAPVQLGEQTGYAQIDTGANPTVISESYASGYPCVGLGTSQAALALAELKKLKIDSLSFLEADFIDLVMNQSTSHEDQEFQALPFPVMVRLGVDVLFSKTLNISFSTGTMHFSDDVQADLVTAHVSALQFVKGLAFFELSIGKHRLKALFDTGAGISVLNQRCLNIIKDELIELEETNVTDPSGGSADVSTYEIPKLDIGGTTVGPSKALLIDLSAVEARIDHEIDIIFGFDAMSQCDWIIDPAGHLIAMPFTQSNQ